FIRIKIADLEADAVFHLARAKIVQERSPAFVVLQILSDVFGEKDVPRVAAVHYPPGDVDTSPGHIRPLSHVHYTADRPAVNAHANLQARMLFKRTADLHRTLSRFLGTFVENQCHAVAGGDL